MSLIVQKYGGTSVGTVERIQAVAEKVAASHGSGNQLVVAVSAMSGETNRLIGLANAIDDQPSQREMDVLVSTGEQVTIALLCIALQKLGVGARSYTGSQVCILTDNAHGKARIREIDSHRIEADLNAGLVVVVAGFQGSDESGNIKLLVVGAQIPPQWH
jgi:aspartate kinase